jgi:6-pyruvoyltetrahydropterin/6-carboxytetrahydropterin synthase
MTTAEISRDFTFEAAHFLPNVPEGHKCGRMHGHSYRLTVAVAGEIDPRMGWVIDFGYIDVVVQPLVAQLDHHCLNDVVGLDIPTSENIAGWVWDRIDESYIKLPVVWIEISETPKSRCRITEHDR